MSTEYCNLIYKHPYSGGGDLKSTETPEFIVRILPKEFEAWKKNPNEIAIVEVVDAYEIFVSRTRGHTGTLERPSHQELMDAFGSIKFEDIFPFMAEHGKCMHTGSNIAKSGLWADAMHMHGEKEVSQFEKSNLQHHLIMH